MLDSEWMNKNQKQKSQVVWHKNQHFSEMWADQVSLSFLHMKNLKVGLCGQFMCQRRVDFYGTNAVLKEKLTQFFFSISYHLKSRFRTKKQFSHFQISLFCFMKKPLSVWMA